LDVAGLGDHQKCEFWESWRSAPRWAAVWSHQKCGDVFRVGSFRLLLALSVVIAHGPSWARVIPGLFDAGVAVVCFFVLSGFYMALVINEKYGPLEHWRLRFLAARAMRLYPTYFLVLAFFWWLDIASWAKGSTLPHWLGLLNFTIIGQDVLQWWVELQKPQPISPIVIVPAWSVASEITFYLIAAVAFKGWRGIVTVFLCALALNLVVHFARIDGTSDSAKFAPSMLVYFALGGLGYIAYTHVRDLPFQTRAQLASIPATIILLVYLIKFHGFQKLGGGDKYTLMWSLFLCVACMTPFLFSLTERSKVDRLIGDLSYGVYLSHQAFFNIAGMLQLNEITTDLVVPLITIGFSALIVLLVDRPLSRWRLRHFWKPHSEAPVSQAA
jgi:peptidoglycan/LPS O-acetylase OafA/YrhL